MSVAVVYDRLMLEQPRVTDVVFVMQQLLQRDLFDPFDELLGDWVKNKYP
jgi:hypothetical protein